VILYLFQWFICALMLLAFVGNLAVRNSPLVKEPHMLTVGRNIATGGWALLGFSCSYLMATEGSLPTKPMALIAIGMLALGSSIKSITTLMPRHMGHQCADCPFVRTDY
jgi:hypothetical protein